jgi:hypothetical protein
MKSWTLGSNIKRKEGEIDKIDEFYISGTGSLKERLGWLVAALWADPRDPIFNLETTARVTRRRLWYKYP